MQTESRSAQLQLALGMAISGTVGAFGVESGLDPISIVFWRCVFGAAFMLAWCIALGYLPNHSLTWRSLGLSAIAGASLVLSWASFFAGIKMTSIATATIVIHFQPFFVVLIGAFFGYPDLSVGSSSYGPPSLQVRTASSALADATAGRNTSPGR